MISFTDFFSLMFHHRISPLTSVKALLGTQAAVSGDYRKATGRVRRGQSCHLAGYVPFWLRVMKKEGQGGNLTSSLTSTLKNRHPPPPSCRSLLPTQRTQMQSCHQTITFHICVPPELTHLAAGRGPFRGANAPTSSTLPSHRNGLLGGQLSHCFKKGKPGIMKSPNF